MSWKPTWAKYRAQKKGFTGLGSQGVPAVDWNLAMQMDAVDDRIDFGNVLTQDGLSSFSLGGWFNREAVTGTHVLISKMQGSGSFTGYELNVSGGGGAGNNRLTFFAINTISSNWLNVESDPGSIPDIGWFHVQITFVNKTTVLIWINGVPANVNYINSSLTGSISSTAPFQINARSSSVFSGRPTIFKELFFEQDVLNDTLAAEIYNGGDPFTPSDASQDIDHVWRCGDTPGDDFTATTGQILDSTGGLTGVPTNTTGGFVSIVP